MVKNPKISRNLKKMLFSKKILTFGRKKKLSAKKIKLKCFFVSQY